MEDCPGIPERTKQRDLDRWLTAHGFASANLDKADMLGYINEWEDAHPEMVASSQARECFQEDIERAWRLAFEAARVSFALRVS